LTLFARVAWCLVAYVAGSIPTSLIVARLFARTDLRQFGSKNLGATNLYRLLGWKGALPAGIFDVAKGAVPVLLAVKYTTPIWFPLVVGASAVMGHVFSPFVRFKGGKGVATAAGVFLGLAPLSILAALAVFALVVKLSGYVSLGSMTAAGAFFATVPLFYPGDTMLLVSGAAIFSFIVYTHRANIGRLRQGTENRFGRSRSAGPSAPRSPS
jgi:glycerol-3-phosphate acyltransferase PlsY